MKKILPSILASLLMLASLNVQAWGGNHGGHRHHSHQSHQYRSNNVGKFLIGTAVLGAAIYALEQSRPQVVRQEVYYPQTSYSQQPVLVIRTPSYIQNNTIDYLPYGSRTIIVDGITYFENGGVFYQNDGYGRYLIVHRPY